MATVRDRQLPSVTSLGRRAPRPNAPGSDSRPAPQRSTPIPPNAPSARVEIDGQVYLLLPDAADRHAAGDHARYAREANLEFVRAGELITAKRRYVIVRADAVPASLVERTPADRPFHGLSRRELQIVVLVAEGFVNKQIADHLKISEWTVSTHLRRIFAKLSVDSRAAMVYRCLGAIGKKNDVV